MADRYRTARATDGAWCTDIFPAWVDTTVRLPDSDDRFSVVYLGCGCADALLNETWALTAAHCLAGREIAVFAVRDLDRAYRIKAIRNDSLPQLEVAARGDVLGDVALMSEALRQSGVLAGPLWLPRSWRGMPRDIIGSFPR